MSSIRSTRATAKAPPEATAPTSPGSSARETPISTKTSPSSIASCAPRCSGPELLALLAVALVSRRAVTPRAPGEACRALGSLARGNGSESERELVGDRRVERQGPLLDGASSIGAQTAMREARDVRGQRLCLLAGAAPRYDPVGQAPIQRFPGGHGPPGEDHVERARLADDARQAHCAAVDQRHPPPPAQHAEGRIFLRDAQIAPESDLQA